MFSSRPEMTLANSFEYLVHFIVHPAHKTFVAALLSPASHEVHPECSMGDFSW